MHHNEQAVLTTDRYHADARDLAFLAATSIDLIVTSPPYWRRRDYGHPDQVGQEATPGAYVEALIAILNGWARLLRPHASVFLNLGDTYQDGFLAGIPARFELAARDAGWNVVNHIVWAKSVGRPEPVAYRLSSRHEAVFQLTRATHAAAIFFDRYALACDRDKEANPGDVWPTVCDDLPADLWELYATRSKNGHPVPFPPELTH
ncbi:MAG: site-specific DNA-methyltransferase [Chloroflexia bacterium]|nr:site-specific DNA-methyltransferase [Chloroflexia bacterium]